MESKGEALATLREQVLAFSDALARGQKPSLEELHHLLSHPTLAFRQNANAPIASQRKGEASASTTTTSEESLADEDTDKGKSATTTTTTTNNVESASTPASSTSTTATIPDAPLESSWFALGSADGSAHSEEDEEEQRQQRHHHQQQQEIRSWSLLLQLVQDLACAFPQEPHLWGEPLRKLITEINGSMAVALEPHQYALLRRAVATLDGLMTTDEIGSLLPLASFDASSSPFSSFGDGGGSLMTGSLVWEGGGRGGGCEEEEEEMTKRKAYLPHYLLYTELKPYLEKSQPPHWMLEPFINSLHIHKTNLLSMFTVTGSAERCRLFGPSRAEELSAMNKVSKKYSIIDEKILPSPRDQFKYALVQLLCQRAPLHVFKMQVLTGNPELLASSTQNATGAGGLTTVGTPSSLLMEATVMRIVQLIESFDQKNAEGKSLEEFCDAWWGQWQWFADQFFAFVDNKLIDFPQFLLTLSRARVQGSKIKNNIILWLIIQCLPLEHIKKLFINDLTVGGGRLFIRLLDFYNMEQPKASPFELRDASFDCLLFRVHHVQDSNIKIDVTRYIPANILHLVDNALKETTAYREWWNVTENHGKNLDFYNLPMATLWKFVLLTNFTSQPIAVAIFDTLTRSNAQSFLPGGIPFSGDPRPLPTMLLFLMTTRTRMRVLDLIEAPLFLNKGKSLSGGGENAAFVHGTVLSPAIIETYARLIYVTSYTRNRFRFCNVLRTLEDPPVVHTVLELLNFRLIRFFKYHDSIKNLFLDLYQKVISTSHHQLFHSLENLLIKLSQSLGEVISFSEATDEIDFGETLNRTLILGLARTLKTKGISSYDQTKKLPRLLSRLFEMSPHVWSQSTLKYFPDLMKDFYLQNSIPKKNTVTREMVEEELKRNENAIQIAIFGKTYHRGTNPLQERELQKRTLVQYYAANPYARRLFLCEIWLLLLNLGQQQVVGSTTLIPQNVLCILKRFTPREVTAFHYVLVDFLLDLLQPEHALSSSFGLREPASQLAIQHAGNLLGLLVWNYQVLNLENLVLALADSDGDPNSFALLEYLLLKDMNFVGRVNFFRSLQVRPDFWRDENPFAHHKEFHDKCPEGIEVSGVEERILPVYFGNICLRMLPILDLLFGRLVEKERVELFEGLINVCAPLYKYHHAPITFVTHLMLYYFDSEVMKQPAFKLQLLSLLQGVSPRFSPYFQQYCQTRDMSHISTSSYFRTLLQHVAGHVQTEHPVPICYQTTSSLQLFEEFPNKSEEAITTALLELLLLPLSPTEIATHLLDVILPSSSPSSASSSSSSSSSSASSYSFSRDSHTHESREDVITPFSFATTPSEASHPSAATPQDHSQQQPFLSLFEDDHEHDQVDENTQSQNENEEIGDHSQSQPQSQSSQQSQHSTQNNTSLPSSSSSVPRSASSASEFDSWTHAENVANNRDKEERSIPTYSQISAASLLLASLPKPFHKPIYERAILFFNQSPLLSASTSLFLSSTFFQTNKKQQEEMEEEIQIEDKMDEEQVHNDEDKDAEGLKAMMGPFSGFAFSDYTLNSTSLMSNSTNQTLLLLHNFFQFGSIEHFLIYPSFVRAMRVSSLHHVYLGCRLVAPFLYRVATNAELLDEIVVELFRALSKVQQFLEEVADGWGNAALEDFAPTHHLDVLVDFFYHCTCALPLSKKARETMQDIIRGMPSALRQHFVTMEKSLYAASPAPFFSSAQQHPMSSPPSAEPMQAG
ncbi:Mediator of RNA polymerase II transcription subunit 23 [Balamuthia mandrillaris]